MWPKGVNGDCSTSRISPQLQVRHYMMMALTFGLVEAECRTVGHTGRVNSEGNDCWHIANIDYCRYIFLIHTNFPSPSDGMERKQRMSLQWLFVHPSWGPLPSTHTTYLCFGYPPSVSSAQSCKAEVSEMGSPSYLSLNWLILTLPWPWSPHLYNRWQEGDLR